jgi:erythronate-4-phosphate dehydrogenase
MIKIVADNAIPFVEKFFSCIGVLELVEGRKITAEVVKDADVLVVRTITKVNSELLDGSTVGIVVSPSSGCDHFDLEYLQQRSIECISTPGSNAISVAEYVLSALCVLADKSSFDLSQKKVGIIGCGKVGSQVRRKLETIGLECLVCDPFLKQASRGGEYCDLSEIKEADVVSLHVPLTRDGDYPTFGMIDEECFEGLSEDVILINTSRGPVVDEVALKAFLNQHTQAQAVLDVWTNEPNIDAELIRSVDIATPHIAGHSMDAKLRATRSVFEQVCGVLNIDSYFDGLNDVFPLDEKKEIRLSLDQSEIDLLSLAILSSYDVRSDAAALRRMLEDNVSERASYFDELRNNYPIRREFSSLRIGLTADAQSKREKLVSLGFRIIEADEKVLSS